MEQQATRPRRRSRGWGDGRRPFGTVSGAIVQVLSEANTDLRVRDIAAQAEQLLGTPLSPLNQELPAQRV